MGSTSDLGDVPLLELPLLGFVFAPEWTPGAVRRFRAWLGRHGRLAAIILRGVLNAT